jgi:hypothetical protein
MRRSLTFVRLVRWRPKVRPVSSCMMVSGIRCYAFYAFFGFWLRVLHTRYALSYDL